MKKSIPFYKQKNDWYCGPACMQMVLARDGKRYTQAELAKRMGTNPVAGTPRPDMVRLLREEGYQVQASSAQTRKNLERYLSQGWSVVVNYREPEDDIPHLAVVERVSNGQIFLHDPYHGPHFSFPWADFERRWHGYHVRTHIHWLLAAKKR